MEERVARADGAVGELNRCGRKRDPPDEERPAPRIPEENEGGDDRRREDRAELADQVRPAEEDARRGAHGEGPPAGQTLVGPEQEAEEARREGGRRGRVRKDRARVEEVRRVDDGHERGGGGNQAVAEEHDHRSVDRTGHQHARRERDRIEGGLGGPTDERREPDRDREPDSEREEVRPAAREVQRRVEVRRRIEGVGSLQKHELDAEVDHEDERAHRPVEQSLPPLVACSARTPLVRCAGSFRRAKRRHGPIAPLRVSARATATRQRRGSLRR